MPKTKMSGSSSSSTGLASEDETSRAMRQLATGSPPSLSSPEPTSRGDEDKSSSPKQESSSNDSKTSRKRVKKTRSASTSAAAAAAHNAAKEDERGFSSKQSKFIRKVYEMASCEENQHALGFSDDGLSLEIRHVPDLGPVLSRYFKHSNPSSFIRQLNNYGFKTISSSSLGSNRHVFAHPHFKRDDSSLLETITRKTAVCVKKKSKGEIIRELQQKNDEQQSHLQQMEMHHLEMFQRIMALEAENKQLRTHLETVRRSFQETTNRMDHIVQGVEAGASAANSAVAAASAANCAYGQRFRGIAQNNSTSLPPPPPMFDALGNPYYSSVDMNRLAFPPMSEHSAERDGVNINLNDPFHLD